MFFFTFSSSCVWAAFSRCSAWAKRDIILPRSSWSVGTINNDHCECPFFDQESNPFAPEPPITTTSYVSHVVISFNSRGQLCQQLVQEEKIFQTTPKWAWFSQGTDKEATRQPVVSSKAKLLWPPYTSTQAINFLFFPSSSPLLVYSYLTIYNVNIL